MGAHRPNMPVAAVTIAPSTHVWSPRWIPRGAIRTGATRSALATDGCIVVSGLQRTTTSENKKKGRRRPSTRPGFTGRLAPRTSPLRLVATTGISGSEAPGEISPPPSDANGDDTHRHAVEPKENEQREGTGDLLGEAERALEELGERHAAAAAAADGDEDDDTDANASIEPSASVDDVVLTTDADGNLRFGDKRDKRVVVRNLFRRMRGKEEMSADELAEWNTRNEEKKAAKAAKKAANKKKNATGGKKQGLVARIKARVGGTGKKRRPRKDAFDRELRGEFDKTKLENFFKRRPGQVAARLAAVLRVAARMIRLWKKEDSLPPEERTRSDRLRAALSGLGPVFVKIGQTLSQRPDLIGEEAADALKSLQMQNAPFPDDVAYGTIAEVRCF